MENKILLFLGAGFSAQANIPIQNKILKEMQLRPQNFISNENRYESFKFLESFIEVGIFFLKKFTNYDTSELESYRNKTDFIKSWTNALFNSPKNISIDVIKSLLEKFQTTPIEDFLEIMLSIFDAPEFLAQMKGIMNAYYYQELISLKEKVRQALCAKQPQVDLEDVFTIFDKSFKDNENWDEFTYSELDRIKHSLLRLFTYYFGLKITKFSQSKTKYYSEFINFVKHKNIEIITTNWDNVIEILLKKKRHRLSNL